MTISISSSLLQLYEQSHKNYDYCLGFLLDSIDSKYAAKAISLVPQFSCSDEKTQITISQSRLNQIKSVLSIEEMPADVIELLLYIAVFFPEI